MEASSPYTFAIIGIIIGFIIGLGCYRLFSKGERHNASLRQTLLEREHQIAELKKSMGSHLTGVFEHVNSIRAQADQLEQKIVEDAQQWHLGSNTPAALKERQPPAQPETTKTTVLDSENSLATPRDYADGKNGTLSENFGLKESDATPQPPRY
ncbi:ZapG family protein [Vreelandella populi]|uniref:DUF1043 family protein n=1 Tax=Vreelandella populi TaxID=2498858 RepID=A0A433LB42_9GAMM|nr:DUF1043 family protein [Halomonas populi]RUR42562.1 DUF1043 family protein [Halomonas populi]RUR45835.1 DUF1043 family protein [Halomonas populi]RUR57139.1 DUF1043 family protein [Halomonas populi]